MSAPALLPAPEVHLRPHCRPASQSFGGAVPAASPARPHARPARGREPDGLSLERIASSSRGGSLVLPPRPGWRDLAGRCWHARPPATSAHQPTRLPSRAHSDLNCKQLSWREPRSPTTPRVEGSGRTVLACPTPSHKRPPTNPAPEPSPLRSELQAALVAGASFSHHAQGGGIWPDGAGMPDPQPQAPTNQPGSRAEPTPI